MFNYSNTDLDDLIDIAEITEEELADTGVPIVDVIFVLEDGTWVSSAGE